MGKTNNLHRRKQRRRSASQLQRLCLYMYSTFSLLTKSKTVPPSSYDVNTPSDEYRGQQFDGGTVTESGTLTLNTIKI